MRLTLGRVLLLAAGGVALAALVVWSGVFRIAASSGHWDITDWLLHTAMRRSVSTWSMGIEAPPLDDPALVHRGAGHFASSCAPCHGAPGTPPSAVAQRMTPHPPGLADRIDEWKPGELFWIVMHGVKFTGMPAWPAQGRDDEVWAMVAFLLELPRLDAERYRVLAFGEASGADADAIAGLGADAVRQCVRCHGQDGAGRGNGAFPILTGQSEAYLLASLQAYATGARRSGFMRPMAELLSPAEMRAFARHFAEATPRAARRDHEPSTDPETLRRGEAIVTRGVPGEGIPPCASCHTADGERRYPVYPLLAGQHAGYIVDQLGAFRKGARGGTPFAHIMATIAERLTDRQIRDAAAYLASLGPEKGGLRR